MLATPALFWLHGVLARRFGDGPDRESDAIDEQGTVIIAGMGRFGQVVNRMLTGLGHRTVVIDNHPATVDRMRRFGIKGFYGDVGRTDLLAAAGIAEAKAVVLAIDDPAKVLSLARFISERYPEVKIIARAYDRHHVYQLYAAGAPESVRELFDSGVRAGKYALAALGHDPEEIEGVAEEFFRQDRRMLEELAELWRPDTPIEDNPAYLAKSREQNAIIEAALRGRTGQAATALATPVAEPESETGPVD